MELLSYRGVRGLRQEGLGGDWALFSKIDVEMNVW